jgi:hypothetical protein
LRISGSGSEDDFASTDAFAKLLQSLLEDLSRFFVGTAFLDVGEVRLVRLISRGRRRVARVKTGGEPAARTVPRVGHRRVEREARTRLVPVGAPVRHSLAGRGVTTLGLSHRTGTDPAAPDGTATCH